MIYKCLFTVPVQVWTTTHEFKPKRGPMMKDYNLPETLEEYWAMVEGMKSFGMQTSEAEANINYLPRCSYHLL